MKASMSQVAYFEDVALSELALNAEVPFLHIRLLDVWIHACAREVVVPTKERLRETGRIRWRSHGVIGARIVQDRAQTLIVNLAGQVEAARCESALTTSSRGL